MEEIKELFERISGIPQIKGIHIDPDEDQYYIWSKNGTVGYVDYLDISFSISQKIYDMCDEDGILHFD